MKELAIVLAFLIYASVGIGVSQYFVEKCGTESATAGRVFFWPTTVAYFSLAAMEGKSVQCNERIGELDEPR